MELYHKYIVQDAIESYNIYATDELIVDYLEIYDKLSMNVTVNDIIINKDLPWNSRYLSMNESIKYQHREILYQCDNLRDQWCSVRGRGYLRSRQLWNIPFMEDILRSFVSGNRSGSISNVSVDGHDIVFQRNNKIERLYSYIISSIADMDHVKEYPSFPWNLDGLSCNTGLIMEVLCMDLPNAIGEWNISGYSSNIIDLHHYINEINIPNEFIVPPINTMMVIESTDPSINVDVNGKIVPFNINMLVTENDLQGHLMVYKRKVNASEIMNNIHLPWNFNRIVTADNVPLRLALLGKRIKSVFTPIKFTEMYHDIDIVCV